MTFIALVERYLGRSQSSLTAVTREESYYDALKTPFVDLRLQVSNADTTLTVLASQTMRSFAINGPRWQDAEWIQLASGVIAGRVRSPKPESKSPCLYHPSTARPACMGKSTPTSSVEAIPNAGVV